MKFLKTIFTNALVLVTLVTAIAGSILLAYADDTQSRTSLPSSR